MIVFNLLWFISAVTFYGGLAYASLELLMVETRNICVIAINQVDA